jgi:type II secretory pathway pseudopilin PulG
MDVRFHYRRKNSTRNLAQSGWMLIVILLGVAIMAIMLEASLAQSAIGDIRHDKEEELFHRGKQYERAISLYFRRFGNYPTSLDQLENTNNIRFLRRKYKDPITGGEFKIIRFGQQHPKLRRNFAAPGTPAGQIGTPIGQPAGGNPTGTNNTFSNSTPISDDVGPIVGVRSKSEKESMKEIQDKNHYKDFEFWFDPTDLPPGGRRGGGL